MTRLIFQGRLSHSRLIYVPVLHTLLHMSQCPNVQWGVGVGGMDPGHPKQRQPHVDDGNEQEVPVVGCALHQSAADRRAHVETHWSLGGLGTLLSPPFPDLRTCSLVN